MIVSLNVNVVRLGASIKSSSSRLSSSRVSTISWARLRKNAQAIIACEFFVMVISTFRAFHASAIHRSRGRSVLRVRFKLHSNADAALAAAALPRSLPRSSG